MSKEKINRERLILDLLNHENYIPMKRKELAVLLGLSKSEKAELDEVIDGLVDKNKIVITKRGKILINRDTTTFVGEFMSTDRGFGFVKVEGLEEDFFVPAGATMHAMEGDVVKIKKTSNGRGRKSEAAVFEIVRRANDHFVGLFEPSDDFGFVVCDDKKMRQDIFIKKKNINGAKKGHKVVAKIINYGKGDKNPEGEIVEIIGHVSEPSTEILSVVKALGIPTDFPEDVLDEVRNISEELDLTGRKDFRNLTTVTIDGADAKDLDDAISIEKLDDGFKLYVHIADVANYVRPNMKLNEEALKRGTSVYLVDRVIPMLPTKLSNNLCSLNKNEPKLALSVEMKIDKKGKVKDYNFYESVVEIDERMTYTDVYKIISDDEETKKKYETLVPEFKNMEELARILRKNRKRRGSIDFNFKEAKIEVDADGKVTSIGYYHRTFANKIIEEFMLITNEVIAEHFYWQELPFVYRNHEEPEEDKMLALATFIRSFGYVLKGKEDIHPKDIQKLLVNVEGSEEEMLISKIALRSMKQAKYESENKGHFGLAARYYCHFTSPIRRYPDLIIHRIIKDSINGRLNENKINYYKGVLAGIAASCSKNERRAVTAEREVDKIKMAQYMADKIGESFDGTISGVTKWGMYVELKNSVEGLVRVESIDDDYYYFDNEYSLVGRDNGDIYTLGDKVKIKVKNVDLLQNNIDFTLIK